MKDTTHNQEASVQNTTDADELKDKAKEFQPLKVKDKFRCPNAHKNGGFPLNDLETMNNLRSAVKGVIAQVGRSILSGQFNLATISFPIWCMAPKSILQQIAVVPSSISYHLMAAAYARDPVERMKHVMITNISYLYPSHNWGKPLNPILGETFQAKLKDGGMVYMEQISHHPPISYILHEGPNNEFRFYGYTEIAVRLRLNSIYLDCTGYRTVSFKDGTEITFKPMQDIFQNVLLGQCHHILFGDFDFIDEKNGVKGVMNIGDVRGKPKDYFSGHIEHHGQKVCKKIDGTYMGHADFDDERYFDVRHMNLI